MESLYNLLAELIARTKGFPSDVERDPISDDSEKRIKDDVAIFLAPHSDCLNHSLKLGIPHDVYAAILAAIDTKGDYLFCKFLLDTLDKSSAIGLEKAINEMHLSGFHSLNTNVEQTGYLILPKVRSAKTSYTQAEIDDEADKTRKTAEYWNDALNANLRNFYYVHVSDLNGYTLKNYVCNFLALDPTAKELKIGVAPLLNSPLIDVFSIDDSLTDTDEKGYDRLYFEVNGINNTNLVSDRVSAAFKIAESHKLDIIMFPEMFGSNQLYELDQHSFNPFFRRLFKSIQGSVPQLIFAPSCWENNSNRVNVYTSSASLVCTQNKQHPFSLRTSAGRRTERLVDIPKIINILHVPGWGRITIPICIDFLQPGYKDLLVTKLKANFILCPSYSSGEYDFLRELDSHAAYGVYSVWLNSCSALKQPITNEHIIGAVSTPVVSSESRITRLTPHCEGNCENGCLFIVTLPLDCVGSEPYEGATTQAEQILYKEVFA